ncbi:hypothetical protein GGI11_001329, partial [Coemansia sp. RSA 2049]
PGEGSRTNQATPALANPYCFPWPCHYADSSLSVLVAAGKNCQLGGPGEHRIQVPHLCSREPQASWQLL